MTLQEVISRFNTTPFLFAGSGITRRYYGLPTWEALLQSFAERIKSDRFSYQAYKSRAEAMPAANGLLPMTASLIQRDFDEAWFANSNIRCLDEQGLRLVESGTSPFKAEIAAFISRNTEYKPEYTDEIKKLRYISKKNLAGVITTNYDLFFETLFEDYKSYVGQDELVFSPIQGVAEIYQIHGSVSRPNSIVINDSDYQRFHEKGKYLAAKLMTIFMEYPIIFIGYSIADANIRSILTDIAACLPNDKFDKLQERFVFIEYKPGMRGAEVSSHSLDLGGRLLNMTKVSIENFGILYDALTSKKAAISVKLLRRFKEDIYTYVVSSQPGPLMQVAALEDTKIDEDKLCISIGMTNRPGEYGLRGIDSNTWYRDIITDELDSLGYSYEKRLELSFPQTIKCAGRYFPVYKYLSQVEGDYPNVWAHAAKSFNDLASNTIRNNRKITDSYTSVADLWAKEGSDPAKAVSLLCHMPEEKIEHSQLYKILSEIFTEDRDVLLRKGSVYPSHIRRLIRYYDYLKWGREKTPAN